MATYKYHSLVNCWRAIGFVLALVAGTSSLWGSTIWNGPNIGFFHSQANGLQDQMTENVRITRGSSHGLYNSMLEIGATVGISPKGTAWAIGTLDNIGSLTFAPCPLEAGNNPGSFVGTTFVVHLLTNDIYLSLTLTNWGGQGGFGDKTFGYIRSTPLAVVAPTVTLTNPANNAVFAAPADVLLGATATVSGGTVTNVTFRNDTTILGSVLSSPFNFSATNLSSGSYALNAVATAGGVSATSPVVVITVVAPVDVSLTSPHISSGSFTFNYSANVGLKYVVERSLDLISWTSVITNVAASDPVPFSDGVTNSASFYRVGRLPNP